MGRSSTSPWDFGELFPASAGRRVYTVSELTGDVRRLLERHVGRVWVSGEVSNVRAQSSGHIYFTLKDAGAQLACVLFRGETSVRRECLQDGRKVVAHGEVTVYEPRGQYQLRVLAVEEQGWGALQAAYERLKRKLQAEGLFDGARKRPLPRFCRRIGVVTSPTGAALRDVVHVIGRRQPFLEIVLAACRVQGEGAAAEVASAIAALNQWASGTEGVARGGLDLILVTRGGGSLEDLWAFNEESVARAIVASSIPVVSAVGHEIDFTISDGVADMRAATPSAAAELITEGVHSSRSWVEGAGRRMAVLASQRVGRERSQWSEWQARLVRRHPRRVLGDRYQRWDDVVGRLAQGMRYGIRERQSQVQEWGYRLRACRPSQILADRRQQWRELVRRLVGEAKEKARRARTGWDQARIRLGLLSPECVLARGYSITRDALTNAIIRRADQVKPGQRLATRLSKGEIRSVAEEQG